MHQDRLYSQWEETALGDANVEIFLAQNVTGRGASSSTSALCEQPPHPLAVGELLKWEPIGSSSLSLSEETYMMTHCQEFRLFPLCLLWLAIWKYLLCSKNEKFVLFKSQHFIPVYQKYPRGCYSPSNRTLFSESLPTPWWDCRLPDIPHPASTLFSYPDPMPWNDVISCNLLTHACLMQMIRNCCQASVLLTGQAGTFLHISQPIARRALISSDFDVCWALWAGVPTVLKRSKSTLHSSAASPHLLWCGKGPSTAVLGSH